MIKNLQLSVSYLLWLFGFTPSGVNYWNRDWNDIPNKIWCSWHWGTNSHLIGYQLLAHSLDCRTILWNPVISKWSSIVRIIGSYLVLHFSIIHHWRFNLNLVHHLSDVLNMPMITYHIIFLRLQSNKQIVNFQSLVSNHLKIWWTRLMSLV